MMRAMSSHRSSSVSLSWRPLLALFFFFSALLGFAMGVSVSEREGIPEAGLLVQAYYSLSLFVVGGLDLGVPEGGPLVGRVLLWISYFGAPVLAASALIEVLLRGLRPQAWALRRLRDHVIVVGDDELALSYLRELRRRQPRVAVVVVCGGDPVRRLELQEDFGALAVNGDVTNEYFLRKLRARRARKILLLDDNSLRSYEAASILLHMAPGIGPRVVIHCNSLRFMRAMENTHVAKSCETFNSYHLAASGLVRSHLLHRFQATGGKDVVVLAGYGRFGQTVLEELQIRAPDELHTVILIDNDLHRRVMVADEQFDFADGIQRKLFEGDISHPEVWDRVRAGTPLKRDADAVFVLGTGREEENLRTALWIRRRAPNAMIIARSSRQSRFAHEVGEEHDIISISINQLVEEHIPDSWLALEPRSQSQ